MTRFLLAILLLLTPLAQLEAGYPYYYSPVVVKEIQQIVTTNFVTVPTPVALFQVTPQAITTPPPVYVAYRPKVEAKAADPCCSPELTARLARIEQALAGMRTPQAGPPPLAEGPPRLRPQAPPPLKLHPETGQVLTLLKRSCAECHTAPGRGDVVLFNAQGEWEPNVSKSEILRAVKPRVDVNGAVKPARMPKGRPVKLSTEEVALVERWAKAD